MVDLDLAYVAGFFDGEGSITIHENGKPSPRGKNPNHTLQVSIGNTDPRILKALHKRFGGCLTYRLRSLPNHRNICQWTLRAAKALPFLEAIEPFIEMKQDQVKLAIAFQRTKVRHTRTIVPLDVLAWGEEQRQNLKQLNAREWISEQEI